MKNNFKFNLKYFLVGLLLVLAINYNIFIGNSVESEDIAGNTTIETVKLGEIKKSIEVVGDAELVDEQSLSFNQAGTITVVNFDAGDIVRKGETIAEIDDSDAYDSIENAKISLQNAQISLKQLYEDIDESKIIQAENSITTAENNLENAKIEFENIKITQENSLNKLLEDIETSKKELANLIKEKENSLSDTTLNKNKTIISIEDDFRTNLDEIEKIIEESDYIMGVTIENKDENDDFEDYLGAKDTTIKNNAKASLLESINLYNSLKASLDNYDDSGDMKKIELILNEYLVIFNKLYETTDYIYKTAEASIISIGSLTQSKIDSMKNTMSTYRSSSLNKVSLIKSSINTLNTLTDTELLGDSNEITIEKQAISIKNSIKSYDETVSNYKLAIEEKQQSIESKVVNLEVAKLNLEELIEGPTTDNVTKANNSIKQANIKLASAYESLEDYMLQSPFDGVIRKIDYMVGDNLTNDTDKYVYIENPNLLEISVMLDQIDIVTVELGQEATITFDTYSTTPVKSKISSIDTTPVQSSGVVSYEVKLVLDDPEFDKKILSGMTANVEIIVESKENILVIKTSSLTENDGKNYLTISKDGKETDVEVEIGIASSGMTEIISGVEKGDIIIIKEFVVNTTEEETSTSLFGGGGGGGGGDRSGPPGGF